MATKIKATRQVAAQKAIKKQKTKKKFKMSGIFYFGLMSLTLFLILIQVSNFYKINDQLNKTQEYRQTIQQLNIESQNQNLEKLSIKNVEKKVNIQNEMIRENNIKIVNE